MSTTPADYYPDDDDSPPAQRHEIRATITDQPEEFSLAERRRISALHMACITWAGPATRGDDDFTEMIIKRADDFDLWLEHGPEIEH